MATFLQLNNKVAYECLGVNIMGFKKALGYSTLNWSDKNTFMVTLSIDLPNGEKREMPLRFEHMYKEARLATDPHCIDTSAPDIAKGKIKISDQNHETVGIACTNGLPSPGMPFSFDALPPLPPVFIARKADKKAIPKWSPFGLTDPPFNLYFTVVHE